MRKNNIWDRDYQIRPNKNIRGQSLSYFVYDSLNQAKYIVKFFDFLKDVSIPECIRFEKCTCIEDVIDLLASSDEFMGDIDRISEFIYYRKRSFIRYIQVCLNEDSGFPHIYVSDENIIIDKHYYGVLVEEAIQGVTLEEVLREDTIVDRADYAIHFLWKLSIVIEKYVKHGIVHRDISPDNIMIKDDEFIVIDPGMVKIIDRNSTEVGYVMGKRDYVSPEQYHGFALEADFTSDIYSIGLIAFEIIAGKNPLKIYINKMPVNPHQELLNKFDRELEDLFFDIIEETERNKQLFLLIRKMLQVDKLNRFDDIYSFQETIKILKEGI